MSNESRFTLTGDSSDAEAAFARVGSSSKDMADDVDSSSRRLADSTSGASHGIADAVDSSEGKFRGLGDVIGGTGDVMDGFKDGNVAQMAMGMADLAGGFTELVIPALTALKGTLLTGLAPAMTAISAHPLIAGILAGGAIIAGLYFLEKKFGLVSGAIDLVKDALSGLWDLFKSGWNNTFGKIKINFEVPDWVPFAGGKGFHFDFPRLHTGGMVPGVGGMEQMAILQAGEQVIPRGQAGGQQIVINVSGVGMGRDFGNAIAQALRDNRLIGVTA